MRINKRDKSIKLICLDIVVELTIYIIQSTSLNTNLIRELQHEQTVEVV